MQQIVVLTGIGIEAHLVEGEPRRHRPAVVIARQAIGLVVVAFIDNLPHTVGGQIGPSYPVIEARGEKRRLIAHVVTLALEKQIQPFSEGLRSATGLDESWHIVGDA